MKSALLHKRAFTGYPNEVELLEAGGDRLFEVDSLRQPGQRMLVALAEDGSVDYPVYSPDKKKVQWKLDDRFGKKFKSDVKKHMEGEVEKAETPKEEQEAVNSPALRQAASAVLPSKPCPKCQSTNTRVTDDGKMERIGCKDCGQVTLNAKRAAVKKCHKCHQERTLDRDGLCHQCSQEELEEKEKTAATTPHVPLTCEIRDAFGQVESAAHRDTTAQCVLWFREHGVPFDQVKGKDDGQRTTYTFTKSAAKSDHSLIEQVIGSGLFNSDEEGHYSGRGCDYCSPGVGNTVYDVTGFRNLQEAQADNTNSYEFQLCASCLNDLYYGEEKEYLGERTQRPIHAAKKIAKVASTVHDLKPLMDQLRTAKDPHDSQVLTAQLISAAKQLGAGGLRESARNYFNTLRTLDERRQFSGMIPRRSQRAADDAWKRLEAEFVHFVR